MSAILHLLLFKRILRSIEEHWRTWGCNQLWACILVLACCAAPLDVAATPRTLSDPTPTGEGAFGITVALDSQRALVGAFSHRTPIGRVGEVHLFDAQNGVLLATFNNPSPEPEDLFGSAVALDGEYALIGARWDKSVGENAGQAYLFDVTSGALLHTFSEPSPTDKTGGIGDWFGEAVDLVGEYALVGAPGDDTFGGDVGQTYLFDVGTHATLATFDDPTPTERDLFGHDVSLDDGLVLVGAPGDDTMGPDVGQVHLFDAANGKLLRTFDDPTPTNGRGFFDGDDFGHNVALFGGRALIGAPGDSTYGTNVGQAFLFDVATGELLHTFDDPTPTDDGLRGFFGSEVALHGDLVLIGGLGDDTNGEDVGQAHVFSAVTGELLETLSTPRPYGGGYFGGSVALDGQHALVGAAGEQNGGHAYLFDVSDLLVNLPGDYNADGLVDGADFLLWQHDPNVGNLTAWQANYGAVGLLSSNMVAPVPEPGSLVLLMTLAASLARSMRRQSNMDSPHGSR